MFLTLIHTYIIIFTDYFFQRLTITLYVILWPAAMMRNLDPAWGYLKVAHAALKVCDNDIAVTLHIVHWVMFIHDVSGFGSSGNWLPLYLHILFSLLAVYIVIQPWTL
jgi:hypothetical protein